MISEQLQFQIQAYLDGSLLGAELEAFQKQLATNEALRQEVELFREMDDLLGETDVIDFKKTIGEVLQANQSDAKSTEPAKTTATIRQLNAQPNSRRKFLSIAAGIALVGLVGTVLFLNNNKGVSAESLYSANMSFPDELAGGSGLRSTNDSDTLAGKTQALKIAWATANEAYQSQQFETALAAINQIEQLDTEFESEIQGNLLFKKGLILLKLNRMEAAIAAFEAVKDGAYIPNAQWKRALVLLKIDVNQAKIALGEIASTSQHPEQKQAAIILQQLN